MTTTEQDARALAYLAGRLREDTYGAGKWDAPGIWTEVSALIGQNLAVTIERVCRHAADPDAKTPGAIRRPYTPGPPEAKRELDVAPVRTRCAVCGLPERACQGRYALTESEPVNEMYGKHDFRRWEPRTVDISPVVEEIKGHIATTHPARDPRALMITEESEASHG